MAKVLEHFTEIEKQLGVAKQDIVKIGHFDVVETIGKYDGKPFSVTE